MSHTSKLAATSDEGKKILPLIIGRDGGLRASKPKDGNAAYIWRLIGFYVSDKSALHCMPTTADFGVEVPVDWKVEAPAEWLDERMARNITQNDIDYCIREKGSVFAYNVWWWTHAERRRKYIKEVLDPIVDEIVGSVPVQERHGLRRWRRAFG